MKLCTIFLASLGATGALLWADPAVPTGGVYKPTFLVLNASWSAGTAFLVTAPGSDRVLLVTCDHLFGPAAGLSGQMTPDEIASEVHGVVGLSMIDKKSIVTAPDYLKVADAKPLDENVTDKDLALFTLSGAKPAQTFTLAEKLPAKGERVWLFARLRGSDDIKLFGATVINDAPSDFRYVFDQPGIILNGTSGAPVLNEKGEVVGMNLGGGDTADKKVFGIANPSTAILAEIKTAMKP